MKKLLISLFAVTILAGGAVAEKSSEPQSRFYGKIVSVDAAQHNMTVHNYKKKADVKFRWDDATPVTFNNRSIAASELKVGQSLMISYVTKDDTNQATKIAVRTPFKKSTQK